MDVSQVVWGFNVNTLCIVIDNGFGVLRNHSAPDAGRCFTIF